MNWQLIYTLLNSDDKLFVANGGSITLPRINYNLNMHKMIAIIDYELTQWISTKTHVTNANQYMYDLWKYLANGDICLPASDMNSKAMTAQRNKLYKAIGKGYSARYDLSAISL